jgi:hypothetical protein
MGLGIGVNTISTVSLGFGLERPFVRHVFNLFPQES